MNGMKLLLLALFLLLAAAPLEAATYWVSKTGTSSTCVNSSSDPGDSGAKSSILGGIACLSAGDTLYIKAGTYSERLATIRPGSASGCLQAPCIPSGLSASQHTVISAAPGDERQVILQGSTRRLELRGFGIQYITIKGFVLDANNLSYVVDTTCTAPSSDACLTDDITIPGGVNYPIFITVENNEIRNSSPYSCWLGARRLTIRGNWIHHCASYGGYWHSRNVIEYNRIHDIGLTGRKYAIHLADEEQWFVGGNIVRYNVISGAGSAAIISAKGTGTVGHPQVRGGDDIYGNITFDNQIGISIRGGSGYRVYNNTSFQEQINTVDGLGYRVGIHIQNTSNSFISNNLMVQSRVWDNGNTSSVTWSNNLIDYTGAASTYFVNQAAGNYQLISSSPARDYGINLGSPYNVDANGVSRPQGSAWDNGACEYFDGAAFCFSFPAAQPPPPQPANTADPSGIITTSGTLQIGGSQFGEYFKGLIDEVRIYNRALNDTEIQTIYQQGSE